MLYFLLSSRSFGSSFQTLQTFPFNFALEKFLLLSFSSSVIPFELKNSGRTQNPSLVSAALQSFMIDMHFSSSRQFIGYRSRFTRSSKATSLLTDIIRHCRYAADTAKRSNEFFSMRSQNAGDSESPPAKPELGNCSLSSDPLRVASTYASAQTYNRSRTIESLAAPCNPSSS